MTATKKKTRSKLTTLPWLRAYCSNARRPGPCGRGSWSSCNCHYAAAVLFPSSWLLKASAFTRNYPWLVPPPPRSAVAVLASTGGRLTATFRCPHPPAPRSPAAQLKNERTYAKQSHMCPHLRNQSFANPKIPMRIHACMTGFAQDASTNHHGRSIMMRRQ